jgi:NADH-quinone oxidoreductase subunit C
VNVGDIAERIRADHPDVLIARAEVTVVVDRDDLHGALARFRDDPDLGFDFLSCLTATDWPEKDPRFWVSYELRSMPHHHRLRVKTGVPGADAHLPSVTGLFPTANHQEREVFDLYGIAFDGHPDLTRILLPDDWEGYPLRKDEELGGVNTRFEGAFIPPVDRRTAM